MSQMLEHKHYLGAAHSFEILTPKDPVAGQYVRPEVAIIKVFYIDDTVNVNDWQAEWEGLKIDAEELPGTPLVLKEDLEHPKYSVQDLYDRGTIFDFDIDEEKHQIIVYARITDLSIVERIKSGELEYVSPALIPRGSEYLKKKNGVDVLSRTLPLHLCIVSNPAYGKEKAKISHLCEGDGEACYSRLKMMTAKAKKKKYADEKDAEGEGGDGTGGENSGIKSKLKLKQADDGIPALEQIPFIKKMIASAGRIRSDINKIKYGGSFHIHNGREGLWTNIQGIDVFVARHQEIKAAMADQCGCTKLAAEEKGDWITVKGTHIFIPEGQDMDQVVKEHFDNLDSDSKSKPSKSDFKSNNEDFEVKINSNVDAKVVSIAQKTWDKIPSEMRDHVQSLKLETTDKNKLGDNGTGHVTVYDKEGRDEATTIYSLNHEVAHAWWEFSQSNIYGDNIEKEHPEIEEFRKAIDTFDDAPTNYTERYQNDWTDRGNPVDWGVKERGFRYPGQYYNEIHSDLTAYALGEFPESRIKDKKVMDKMMVEWRKLHPGMKTAAVEEKGNWITVKGTHIFIPDGADPDKVIKEHFDELEDKHKPKPQEEMTDDEIVDKMHDDHPNMSEKTVRKNLDIYKELNPKLEKTKKDLESSLKKDLPGTPVISGRVKNPYSGVAKVAIKPKYADVSKLQDNVGMRAMYNDVTSVKEAMKIVRENYDVVEEDDYIDKPKFDGYRSYHAIIKSKETGIESELQVRTERQEVFANWAHDLYKPPNDDLRHFVETHKEMSLKYQVDMGNYFSELDSGRKPKKPICPKEILKVMMCL